MTDTTHRYELALEIGEEAIRQGKWQQAMTCFRTALTGLPREPRVYNGMGDTYVALADSNRALACYKEAARLDPNIPDYTEKVANLQVQMETPDDAARSFLIAGDTYWRRGRPEKARECWERAASLLDHLIGPHERLVMYHQWRGDDSGVLRHCLVLADLLVREGRCLMAMHTCYLALSIEPDNRLVWAATDKAWACVAARDGAGKGDLTQIETGGLVNAGAEFAQWQLSAGFHQRSLQGTDGIEEVRDDFLRQAMLHEGYGRAGLAIQFYEKAIASGLDSPAIFFAVGLLYRLVGRQADAQAALTLAGRHRFYQRVVELLNEND